jgi:uncharacterized protein DUF3489
MFNKISEAQRSMLEAAAARQDRLLQLPADLRGGAAKKVVAKLIGVGWIKEVKAIRDAPVWRRDAANGGAFALKLTAAGMKTITTAGDDRAVANTAVESVTVEKTAPVEPPRHPRRSGTGAERQANDTAALRDRARVAGVSPAVRPPREGSKLDRVLAMLSATSGATIAELIAATRWLPHTTRAVLTGLRKRGYELSVTRRERDGASVYRIVGPGIEPKW